MRKPWFAGLSSAEGNLIGKKTWRPVFAATIRKNEKNGGVTGTAAAISTGPDTRGRGKIAVPEFAGGCKRLAQLPQNGSGCDWWPELASACRQENGTSSFRRIPAVCTE